MTREEFIEQYCRNSNITWEQLSKRRVALPCHCDADDCQGWAMIPNDPDSIQDHIKFHGDEGLTN